ncbi:MAG: hypothetical protein M0C28_00250 [Candidatus Moduliflexus flocculans]|nr:hypothetical protein [Candidatus Moduliflexus flocculans]
MPRLLFSQKLAWSLEGSLVGFQERPLVHGGGRRNRGSRVRLRPGASFVASVAGPGNPASVPAAALVGIPLYVRAENDDPHSGCSYGEGNGDGGRHRPDHRRSGHEHPRDGHAAGIFRLVRGSLCRLRFLTAVGAGLAFAPIA